MQYLFYIHCTNLDGIDLLIELLTRMQISIFTKLSIHFMEDGAFHPILLDPNLW